MVKNYFRFMEPECHARLQNEFVSEKVILLSVLAVLSLAGMFLCIFVGISHAYTIVDTVYVPDSITVTMSWEEWQEFLEWNDRAFIRVYIKEIADSGVSDRGIKFEDIMIPDSMTPVNYDSVYCPNGNIQGNAWKITEGKGIKISDNGDTLTIRIDTWPYNPPCYHMPVGECKCQDYHPAPMPDSPNVILNGTILPMLFGPSVFNEADIPTTCTDTTNLDNLYLIGERPLMSDDSPKGEL